MYKVIKRDDCELLVCESSHENVTLLKAENIKIVGSYENKIYIKSVDRHGRRKTAYYIDLEENELTLIVSDLEKWNIKNDIDFIIPKEKNSHVFIILSENDSATTVNYLYLEDGFPVLATEGSIIECVSFNKIKSFVKVAYKNCIEIYDLEDGTPLYMTDHDVNLFVFENRNIIMEVLYSKNIRLVYMYSVIFKQFILLFRPKENTNIEKIVRDKYIVYEYVDENSVKRKRIFK